MNKSIYPVRIKRMVFIDGFVLHSPHSLNYYGQSKYKTAPKCGAIKKKTSHVLLMLFLDGYIIRCFCRNWFTFKTFWTVKPSSFTKNHLSIKIYFLLYYFGYLIYLKFSPEKFASMRIPVMGWILIILYLNTLYRYPRK